MQAMRRMALSMALVGVVAGALTARAGLPRAQAADPGSAYRLSDEDRGLDCRKLTGRITVRLMQLRSEPKGGGGPGTAFSEAVQGIAGPAAGLFWGKSSSYLTEREAHLARDHAQINAYNQLLASKGCATFDIPAELAKGADASAPRPQKKAPASGAK
jgi:hypothetical protein